ncbi:MAG: hypothetical protein EOR94_29775 [Mesorhizobium sp.]|nr:MAG: hypothetical protein EOR94_29775 [Mesorhizobium sp.]
MAKDLMTSGAKLQDTVHEPEILLVSNYEPIIPPAAASVGRGVMRRIIEGAIETFFPVVGSGVTELYRQTHPSLADRIRDRWQQRITRSVNRMGSTLEAHEIVLRDLQSFVVSKANYEHAGKAGHLSFVQTGMWRDLRTLAEGKADGTTMQALASGLQQTATDVEVIIASLTAARDIMLGQPENIAFSHRLDNVLYGPFGKVGIRDDIEQVLQGDPANTDTQQAAKNLCNRIEQFNENVAALAFERRP